MGQSFIRCTAAPSTGEVRLFITTVWGMILFCVVGKIGVFNGVMVDWRVVVKLRLALYFLVDRLVNV